jgi:hypothetical protein
MTKKKLNLNLITKQELNIRIEKPHILEQITIHNQIYKTDHKNRFSTQSGNRSGQVRSHSFSILVLNCPSGRFKANHRRDCLFCSVGFTFLAAT